MSDQQETKEGPDAKVESGSQQSVGFWELTTRVMSIMALLISLLTAYFNIIRRTDEMSVVIDNFPIVYIDSDSGNLGLGGLQQRFTFINSGSDSMAVTEEGISVGEKTECEPLIGLSYDIAPVVLKSGEIISQALHKVKQEQLRGWKRSETKGDDAEILDPKVFKPQVNNEMYVCAFFTIVSSSAHLTERKMVPLYKGKLKIMSQSTPLLDAVRDLEYFFDTDRPITIYHRYGTIFNL